VPFEIRNEYVEKARKARKILDIQIVEARALKNRTGCESIGDFILLLREYLFIDKKDDLKVIIIDALSIKKKGEDFLQKLQEILEKEEE